MVITLPVSEISVDGGIGVKMGSKVKKCQKMHGEWSNEGVSGVDDARKRLGIGYLGGDRVIW